MQVLIELLKEHLNFCGWIIDDNMDVSIVVIEDDGFIYILVIIPLFVLIIEDNNRLVVLNVVVGNKVSEK